MTRHTTNNTELPLRLDHVPHWDDAKAMPYVEKSYVKYHMTIDVPDVKCEKVRDAGTHGVVG